MASCSMNPTPQLCSQASYCHSGSLQLKLRQPHRQSSSFSSGEKTLRLRQWLYSSKPSKLILQRAAFGNITGSFGAVTDGHARVLTALQQASKQSVWRDMYGAFIGDVELRKRSRERNLGLQLKATADSSLGGDAEAERQPEAEGTLNERGQQDVQEKTMGIFQLGTYFGLWYLYNVIFNIYNKKTLNIFPFPWFMASLQLFVGGLWMLGLWGLRLQPCPPVTKEFIFALLGPAFFHTVGHISACISFSKVAVSFTHIIKSAEPVFSVIFSTFLGDSYPIGVWLSLIPIVLGCSLAAVTEVTFNFAGFWGAMISNVGFVLRNIYSKKSLKDFKQFDGINLYAWITMLSFAYLFPVAIFMEGSQWVAGYHQAIAALGQASTFHLWVLLSGIFYHLYNQASYQALDGISPLTFSVGNTMKRVVVIIATIIVFRNPVRPLNAIGSAIAILGTFLYSQAGQKSKKKVK